MYNKTRSYNELASCKRVRVLKWIWFCELLTLITRKVSYKYALTQ